MNSLKFSRLLVLACLLLPATGQANDLSVRPYLIDESTTAGDIITRTISLENDYTNRKLILFATVNEITVDETGDIKSFTSPVMSDRTNTITSWLEITRGRIEIEPGGSTTVPLTIRINHNAEPGEYHAFVGFAETKKRPDAEAMALAGTIDGVVVKLTIGDEREPALRLEEFTIDRFVLDPAGERSTISISNNGDLPAAPVGEIIFYDNRGNEVAAVPVNTDGKIIAPQETLELETPVAVSTGIGRYKANINLQYGENQTASLHDSVTFYQLSWKYMLAIFVFLFALVLFVLWSLRRAFAGTDYDDRDDVLLFVRDGHEAKPKDHDIDLSTKK